MMMLQGKVALVTGASSGIGREIARLFAAHGVTVGLVARRADRLAALASEIEAAGGRAVALPADLAEPGELQAALTELLAQTGRLDVLVNNAGLGVFGRAPTPAEFDQIFAVNVRAVWQLSQWALPHLEAVGGCVLNLGSVVVERPFVGEMVYAASKGAVAAMSRSMAATWGKRGVRVNLIQPGVVESEFTVAAGLPPEVAAASHAASAGLNALATTGQPADVARAALFLASDQARFITGATLNVDAGFALAAVGG